MSAIKEHYHEKIEIGQRSSKQHPIGWLNMPGYKPETWSPIVGCSKVSPGCDNCYAERMANRLAHNPKTIGKYYFTIDHNTGKWNGTTHCFVDEITKPLTWKEPRMVFVCSMGDLFHKTTPFEWIDKVLYNIAVTEGKHIFIVLTKRPERMAEYFSKRPMETISGKILSNLWIGVTAENQEQANKRIPILLQIPAYKRFVSVEPMLGPVDFTRIEKKNGNGIHICEYQVLKPITTCGDSNRPALDWVICGGETGFNARPINQNWAIELKNQCKEANVPFFFKQWGEWEPRNSGSFALHNDPKSEKYQLKKVAYGDNPFEYSNVSKVGKKNAGNILDGQQYHEWPKN